jgi:DsbC/DsbD-like thiol-disulfide interchange protein
MFKFCLSGLLGLVVLSASPALAQSQDEVLDAVLVPGWQMPNGHRMAALHLTLAPHWKTYWRAPGEGGIPPQFNWTGSQNLRGVSLHWPSPEVILLQGVQSIGYLDQLVLPLEISAIDPAQPVELRLQMDLGICKDICMPAALTLQATLTGAGAHDARIATALASGPIKAAEAGLDDMACDISPTSDGLRIRRTRRSGSMRRRRFATAVCCARAPIWSPKVASPSCWTAPG